VNISKTKILLLNVNREGWHSGNMIYDMMAVQKACDTTIYGPGNPGYDSVDLIEIISKLYGNDKPDIIYSYFTPNERVRDVYQKHYKIPEALMNFPKNLDKIKTLKIFALSDFWARRPDQYAKDLIGSTFQYCFCCFTPPYSNPRDFWSFFNNDVRKEIKFVAYPRCVDKNCFKEYGLEKKYDIITLGVLSHFYPLRSWMHNFLSQNSSKMNIKYKNHPRCGAEFRHNDFVREKYAMAINSSKMMASCGGRYHLAFNKIFESMGCGTAYIGERPYGEQELHMQDGYNYIAVSPNNFTSKIMEYLKNPEQLKKIVHNARDTFEKYHHIDSRAMDFVKIIEEILKK